MLIKSDKVELDRIQLLQRQGYQWVVDADIQCFFDSIDHTLLMAQIGKLITDAGILGLIQQWLCATVVDGERRFVLSKGVAQGSPIGPLLSNLYLHLNKAVVNRRGTGFTENQRVRAC